MMSWTPAGEDGAEGDQLQFPAGAWIKVLEEGENDGWWLGEYEGEEGYFPSAYTVPADPAAATPGDTTDRSASPPSRLPTSRSAPAVGPSSQPSSPESRMSLPSNRSAPPGIGPGSRVSLRRLQSAPEFNGKVGIVKDFDTESERWQVELPDGEQPVLLTEDHLEPMPSDGIEPLAAAPSALEDHISQQDRDDLEV